MRGPSYLGLTYISQYRGCWRPGVVSPTFCELSNIIWRKYTMPEITFMIRISDWTFVCETKAWLWAHVQFFFEYPCPKFRFFCPPPPPAHLTHAIFPHPPPPPSPYPLGPRPPVLSHSMMIKKVSWYRETLQVMYTILNPSGAETERFLDNWVNLMLWPLAYPGPQQPKFINGPCSISGKDSQRNINGENDRECKHILYFVNKFSTTRLKI